MSLTRPQEVIAFDLMQWSANEMGSWASGEFVNYRINIDVNHTGYSAWKVPNMRNGCVRSLPAFIEMCIG
jgi:hypothetical protein